MEKICYILPKYDANTEEHFFHIYNLLEEIGKNTELYLVIEKCIGTPKFNNVKRVYTQGFSFLPLRILEMLLILINVRLNGCKKIYVHYSYYGAIIGSIITKLTFGKTYYWHCGLVKDFFIPFRLNKNIERKFGENEGSIYSPDLSTLIYKTLPNKIHVEIPITLTFKLIDHLVTGTKTMAQYYHDNFSIPLDKTIVIPNEIDISRFEEEKKSKQEIRQELGINTTDPIVLFVHRLSKRKGTLNLPTIIENVNKQLKNAKFIIAGDGPNRKDLEAELEKRQIDNVTLTGWIPNKKIHKYFSAADVYIMPSDEEGFPRVLLEAMVCGIPFVVSNVGGVRDILTPEQQEFMVNKGDLLFFSQKLVTLLNDRQKQQKLVNIGKERVKEFDMKLIARQYIEKIAKG